MTTSAFVPPPEALRLQTRRVEPSATRRADTPPAGNESALSSRASGSFADRLDDKLTQPHAKSRHAESRRREAHESRSKAQDTPQDRRATDRTEATKKDVATEKTPESVGRSTNERVETGKAQHESADQVREDVTPSDSTTIESPDARETSDAKADVPQEDDKEPSSEVEAEVPQAEIEVDGVVPQIVTQSALSDDQAVADESGAGDEQQSVAATQGRTASDPLAALNARRPAIRVSTAQTNDAHASTQTPIQAGADAATASTATSNSVATSPDVSGESAPSQPEGQPAPPTNQQKQNPEAQSGVTTSTAAVAQAPRSSEQVRPNSKQDSASSNETISHATAPKQATGAEQSAPKVVSDVGLKPESLLGDPLARSASSARSTSNSAPSSADRAEAFAATVNRGLSAALQQKGGSVLIRLQPDALGSLKIQMTIDRGTVSVDLQAASSEARELLSNTLGSLRASLEGKGLSVERLAVQPTPTTQHSTPTNASEQQSGGREDPRSSTHHDAGGGASRGRDDTHQHDRDGGAGAAWNEASADDQAESAGFDRWFRLSLDAVA